jgi:hypothetical protein
MPKKVGSRARRRSESNRDPGYMEQRSADGPPAGDLCHPDLQEPVQWFYATDLDSTFLDSTLKRVGARS